MNISETIVNLFTILIAPTVLLIGIIAALVFVIIRKINNIDKIINQIINENHK